MALPRRHLLRYYVIGTRKDGSNIYEAYSSGREAYIMENFYKRNGAPSVRIVIKAS